MKSNNKFNFSSHLILMLLPVLSFGQVQDEKHRLDEDIDQVTYDWDLEAEKLKTYDGLAQLCGDSEYRAKIFKLLNDIHHYDTVLYEVLRNLRTNKKSKEVKQTLKDIRKFEEKYDSKSFAHYMNQECKAMNEIEKEADQTRNQVGIYSYSGQVYILETELYKYVNAITDRVDKIRLHVHHLSDHYEN